MFMKTKYLTEDEKRSIVIDEILFFVEKLEKKYKVEIKYNVDRVDPIKK